MSFLFIAFLYSTMRVNNEIPLSEMVFNYLRRRFYAQTDRRSLSQYFQQHFVDVFGLNATYFRRQRFPIPHKVQISRVPTELKLWLWNCIS